VATDEFRAAVKCGKSNLEALREVARPEFFEVFTQKAKEGVEKMLNLMQDGGVGLACGHSPVIEAAAEAFGKKMNGLQLKECDYVTFIQDDMEIRVPSRT
jgi:hypothetical protein